MPHIALTRPLPEAGLAELRRAHTLTIHDPVLDGEADEDRIIALARGAKALISTIADPITARVLEASAHLKVVAQFGVGVDNIDLEAARRLGIPVANTPGVLTDATADFAFALLLAVARRVVEADRFVREERFERWETMLLLGTELQEKTLGIIGMGRIGVAMARRALGFGMHIVYHNRRPANLTLAREVGARYVSLEELLAESDVVSLHCALNAESRHLIDRAALRRMKPAALLVNTARGAVVDEAALVEALQNGEIAGAGLDVFEREPEVHAGLLEQERVVLAPHLASATVEARSAMARMAADAALAALNGEDIPHRVV